jgi:hypothetical protein
MLLTKHIHGRFSCTKAVGSFRNTSKFHAGAIRDTTLRMDTGSHNERAISCPADRPCALPNAYTVAVFCIFSHK